MRLIKVFRRGDLDDAIAVGGHPPDLYTVLQGVFLAEVLNKRFVCINRLIRICFSFFTTGEIKYNTQNQKTLKKSFHRIPFRDLMDNNVITFPGKSASRITSKMSAFAQPERWWLKSTSPLVPTGSIPHEHALI